MKVKPHEDYSAPQACTHTHRAKYIYLLEMGQNKPLLSVLACVLGRRVGDSRVICRPLYQHTLVCVIVCLRMTETKQICGASVKRAVTCIFCGHRDLSPYQPSSLWGPDQNNTESDNTVSAQVRLAPRGHPFSLLCHYQWKILKTGQCLHQHTLSHLPTAYLSFFLLSVRQAEQAF